VEATYKSRPTSLLFFIINTPGFLSQTTTIFTTPTFSTYLSKMFFKPALLIAAMVAFVAATPIPGDAGNCNTGNIQCCQQVHDSKSAQGALLASIVGVSVSDITGSIGAQCSPISAVALGGGAKWCIPIFDGDESSC
jgi:hypothetical protein